MNDRLGLSRQLLLIQWEFPTLIPLSASLMRKCFQGTILATVEEM